MKKKTLCNQSILTLLLGISIGSILCTFWRIGSFLNAQETQEHAFFGEPEVGNGKGTNSNSNGDNIGKMKRFWKYYQTYKYIPPASRYDYIPVPAKECGVGPNFDLWWKLSVNDRSRSDEDKFIYQTFFKNQTSDFMGTYVELGAYNGRVESNTRFFDLCLGWKGLLIEGNPENYQKTVENRWFAHKMSFAPSCSAEYESTNKTIQFYRYPMTNVGLVGHAITYTGKPTVDVPCGPLSPVLEDIFANDRESEGTGGDVALPTLSFLSLDVEGSEDKVLSTIDFKAIQINVLMIEIVNTHCKQRDHCEVRNQVRAKMAAEGYKRYIGLVEASDIYVHHKSPFQVPESIATPK